MWFADTLRLWSGEVDGPASLGVLGGYDVLASLYVVCSCTPAADLVAFLRHALADVPEVLAGVTEVPSGRGAAVRILGHTSKSVQDAMSAASERARIAVIGGHTPELRKG